MTTNRSLLLLILVLLCAVVLSGCTSAPPQGKALINTSGTGFPMTWTDDLGRTVTFDAPPQRVVSLAPSNTEILFALGLGDRVVGVDVYSNYPAEAKAKPTMGGMTNVTEAKVIAARPDLVLVGQFTPASTIDNLTKAGLKCVSTHPDNVTDTYRTIGMFGDLFGVPDRARDLVTRLEAEVGQTANKTAAISRNASSWPAVLVIITPGNESYVADNAGYMGDLIALAGGRNVATGPVMTPEAIVAANPDVIVVPLTDWTVATRDSLQSGQEPWMRNLTAVKEGRVRTVSYDVVGRPGPRVGQAAAEMARAIHPELFANNTG